VSALFLFKGYYYAVEQSGRLLHHATFLFEAGRYDVALGLALLGIEELGKGRICRDLWKAGKPVELAKLKATLEDHPAKLKAGQTRYPLTSIPGDALSGLLADVTGNPPHSSEFREAFVKLRDLALRRGKRTPYERLAARERAFYVDPDPSGTEWRRPSETPKEAAEEVLLLAVGDYGDDLSALENPQGPFSDPLQAWPERPSLPSRVWPKDASKPPPP
jgi:AbiV family abortive infection protein